MRLGSQIKELRIKEGLTQVELSEKTGLTVRTIQRIENHDVEPSKHSLKKIGETLNHNFNEQKLIKMKKKQNILYLIVISISLLIIVEFIIGVLNWNKHWWIILSWFTPVLLGISVPYYKRKRHANNGYKT